MGLGAEEVEAVMVDSEDTGGWHQDIAAALDEEEGGAKQGEGTEESCDVESLRSGHLRQDNRAATSPSSRAPGLPAKAALCFSLLPPPSIPSPPLLASSCTSPSVPSPLALCQTLFPTWVIVVTSLSRQAGSLAATKHCFCTKKVATLSSASPSPCLQPSAQAALTQELSTGLVGTECLSLLPVLANQVEPGVTGCGVVELGWDVLLDFTPVCRG